MKKAIEFVSRWTVWKLSGTRVFLIMFGGWFVLGWVLGPVFDTAYVLSMFASLIGPTALFCFLFARHWFRRADYPGRESVARRLGCIIAGGVTAWFAMETAFSYLSMEDAPRGVVWDVNILIAPALGAISLILTRAVINPSSMFRGRREHSEGADPADKPRAGG